MHHSSWHSEDVLNSTAANSSAADKSPDFISIVKSLSDEISLKNQTISQLRRELQEARDDIQSFKQKERHAKPKQIDSVLSSIVKKIYNSLKENQKFILAEPYNSSTNKDLRKVIANIITTCYSNYTEHELNCALHSRYSLEKRREANKENIHNIAAYNRAIARKHSVYETRLKIVRKHHLHEEMFAKLTPGDMSDYESDENGGFIAKPPAARSPTTSNAIVNIDKFVKYRKARRKGSPSKRNM